MVHPVTSEIDRPSYFPPIVEIASGLTMAAATYLGYPTHLGPLSRMSGYAASLAAIIHGTCRIYSTYTSMDSSNHDLDSQLYFSKHEGNGLKVFFKKSKDSETQRLNKLYIAARVNAAKNFIGSDIQSEENLDIDTQMNLSKGGNLRFKKRVSIREFKFHSEATSVAELPELNPKLVNTPSRKLGTFKREVPLELELYE